MVFFEKHLRAPGTIEIAGRRIKRYHIDASEPEVEAAAYAFLPRLLPEVDETPPAGFAVLHRARNAAYINAYSWVWDNVLECRTAAAGIPYLGCPDDDVTHFTALARPWIGCVWELPPLEHERASWVRNLLDPETPNLPAYLADMFPEGKVGR